MSLQSKGESSSLISTIIIHSVDVNNPSIVPVYVCRICGFLRLLVCIFGVTPFASIKSRAAVDSLSDEKT